MVGHYNPTAPSLTPPSNNAQLLNVTQSAFHFTGVTTIVLNDSNLNANTMTVTNANVSGGVETFRSPATASSTCRPRAPAAR